jgi:hypothetical protein
MENIHYRSTGDIGINCLVIPDLSHIALVIYFLKKLKTMLTLILYLAGIVGFILFFKFIDWFEKI